MTDLLTIPEYKSLKKGGSKYRNKVIHADGKKFDSKKEYGRYLELLQMEREGKIVELKCQKRYTIRVNDKIICAYIADFSYCIPYKEIGWRPDIFETIVEDVKSEITRKNPVYRLKKKLMKAVYYIDIKEI